jgi:hypothetical protein
VRGCGSGMRVWDDPPAETLSSRQAGVYSNLLLRGEEGDVTFLVGDGSGSGSHAPARAKSLVESWRFSHNWRDLAGMQRIAPLNPRDRKVDTLEFLSEDPASPDFLRPAAHSPLATGGAGKDDPSLPIYVGAVPPKGTPAWDWDKTWRWRMKQTHRGDAEGAEKKTGESKTKEGSK